MQYKKSRSWKHTFNIIIGVSHSCEAFSHERTINLCSQLEVSCPSVLPEKLGSSPCRWCDGRTRVPWHHPLWKTTRPLEAHLPQVHWLNTSEMYYMIWYWTAFEERSRTVQREQGRWKRNKNNLDQFSFCPHPLCRWGLSWSQPTPQLPVSSTTAQCAGGASYHSHSIIFFPLSVLATSHGKDQEIPPASQFYPSLWKLDKFGQVSFIKLLFNAHFLPSAPCGILLYNLRWWMPHWASSRTFPTRWFVPVQHIWGMVLHPPLEYQWWW